MCTPWRDNIYAATSLRTNKRTEDWLHILIISVWVYKEEFEDTKGVIRICISKKNRQYNGQKKKCKKINNDLQNIHGTTYMQLRLWGQINEQKTDFSSRSVDIIMFLSLSYKNRQYNGQKKKCKKINNDLQNIHIKLKIESHEPH
jgi:hypothetical protein